MKELSAARLIPEYVAPEDRLKDLMKMYRELEPCLRLAKPPDVPVNVSMKDGQLHIEPRSGNPSLRDRLTIVPKTMGRSQLTLQSRSTDSSLKDQ